MEHISEFWQGIGTVLGALGGLSAFLMFLLMFKQNKRIKTNEADRGEIKTFREIIDGLRKEIDCKAKEIINLNERVAVLEDRDGIKTNEISIYKKVMDIKCTRKQCPRDIAFAKIKGDSK